MKRRMKERITNFYMKRYRKSVQRCYILHSVNVKEEKMIMITKPARGHRTQVYLECNGHDDGSGGSSNGSNNTSLQETSSTTATGTRDGLGATRGGGDHGKRGDAARRAARSRGRCESSSRSNGGSLGGWEGTGRDSALTLDEEVGRVRVSNTDTVVARLQVGGQGGGKLGGTGGAGSQGGDDALGLGVVTGEELDLEARGGGGRGEGPFNGDRGSGFPLCRGDGSGRVSLVSEGDAEKGGQNGDDRETHNDYY